MKHWIIPIRTGKTPDKDQLSFVSYYSAAKWLEENGIAKVEDSEKMLV